MDAATVLKLSQSPAQRGNIARASKNRSLGDSYRDIFRAITGGVA